jgi:hypothetical protein
MIHSFPPPFPSHTFAASHSAVIDCSKKKKKKKKKKRRKKKK